MASFLSGLLGGLKGAMGGMSGGGAQNPAGGLMAAIPGAVGADPTSDLGNFSLKPQGGGLMSQPALMSDPGTAPPPAAPKPPGFLKRINTVDPSTGMSTVDKFDRFGARLQDISDGGGRVKDVESMFAGRQAKAKQAQLAAQIDQHFGDDPRMAFLLKSNPEEATKALAEVYKSRNEAYTLSEAQRRMAGDQVIGYAPKTGVSDGFGYAVGQDGEVDWGDQRGRTWSEEETGRHNRESERLGFGGLDIQRQNAGTSAGHLGVARERLDFDRGKDAREAAGGGGGGLGGGPLGSMSTEALIAALRGAR